MAARANAGEMRTKITIKNPVYTIRDGFSREEFVNAFTRPVWCKWVNAHGAEIYQAAELHLREPATITMRYSPRVTVKSRIWRERDTDPYVGLQGTFLRGQRPGGSPVPRRAARE